MNDPLKSKINYTALAVQVLTLLVVFDVIPSDAQEPFIIIIGLVGPTLIQVFRTKFTGNK